VEIFFSRCGIFVDWVIFSEDGIIRKELCGWVGVFLPGRNFPRRSFPLERKFHGGKLDLPALFEKRSDIK
jgi:hypothetical protein